MFTNRLIHEDSPYLLQHAHNPVDWHPWRPEAFEHARCHDKPVFLSIGYSTCHWCHVMEKESFEHPGIAELLNTYFVPVKVDRERRPDIDAYYMTAVQLLTGQGGWPLSAFLTPEGNPFYGGTYFPRGTFADLLDRVHVLWSSDRESIREQAGQVARAVRRATDAHERAETIDLSVCRDAVNAVMSRYDPKHGGFGAAPKFPSEPVLQLLLSHAERTGDRAVRDALEHTLHSMARGGIYDQAAGGFHRYATDASWQVPHFEKMLYNQAQLARAYLGAWRLTGDPEFARIVRETLDYVLAEMTAPGGGFYSATDADSEGEEGLFFLWTPDQVREALDAALAESALEYYGITETGNFEGRNILHREMSLRDFARKKGIPPETFRERTAQINRGLLEYRRKREPPYTDEKILTAWNGMMISALALVGDQLPEPRYLDAAASAAEFLWENNRTPEGALLRVNLNGRASVEALLEDHAFLAEAFLALFDATGEGGWLENARKTADALIIRFQDDTNGGFYLGGEDRAAASMARIKDAFDGPTPSGNSAALDVLLKLERRTGEPRYRRSADRLLSAFSYPVRRNPAAFPSLLSAALDRFQGETGARRYAAGGAVAATALLDGDELTVSLAVRPGWRVTARAPREGNASGIDLALSEQCRGWTLERVEYPPPDAPGSLKKAAPGYAGTITISARVRKTGTGVPCETVPRIRLRLQACDEKTCLATEIIEMLPLKR
jgi:hypothetical protein